MTKKKVFLSTMGLLAAAGAVAAGVVIKKRRASKGEGEPETQGAKPGISEGMNPRRARVGDHEHDRQATLG